MRIAVSLVLGLWVVALGAGCAVCDVSMTDPCDGGDCFGQTYCGVDAGVTACVPSKPLGASCSRNGECVQNACVDGVCVVNTDSTCP